MRVLERRSLESFLFFFNSTQLSINSELETKIFTRSSKLIVALRLSCGRALRLFGEVKDVFEFPKRRGERKLRERKTCISSWKVFTGCGRVLRLLRYRDANNNNNNNNKKIWTRSSKPFQ